MKDAASSHLPRRKLLLALLGGMVSVGVLSAPTLSPRLAREARRIAGKSAAARRFLSLAHAEMEEWAAQVGAVFLVDGGYRMKLVGVRPLSSSGRRPGNGRSRAFLAVFRVLGGQTMAGDLIYTANHRQYGTFDLFLSMGKDRPNGARMHALFN